MQTFAHGHGVNGQHKHLVIGKELFFHGLAETDAIHFFAVFGNVVHGADFDAVFFGFLFAALAVKAWCRRHVNALFRLEEFVVVDFDKVGFVLPGKGHAGGAMRLVANNQIEFEILDLLLSFGNHLDGLVGGKHDCHAALPCRLLPGVFQLLHDGTHVRRCGESQVRNAVAVAFFVVFPHGFGNAGIRTDANRVDWHRGIRGPFPKRLPQEGDGRDEEKNRAPALGFVFGDT